MVDDNTREIKVDIEAGLRINTTSEEVAIHTKATLEQSFKRKFAYAISTRNFIMLDCDDKTKFDKFLAFCRGLALKECAKCIIYETPNGYHAFLDKFMPRDRVRRFLIHLRDAIKHGKIDFIDLAHVEASLRRGYITLRLNQIRRVAIINELGEVKLLEAMPE